MVPRVLVCRWIKQIDDVGRVEAAIQHAVGVAETACEACFEESIGNATGTDAAELGSGSGQRKLFHQHAGRTLVAFAQRNCGAQYISGFLAGWSQIAFQHFEDEVEEIPAALENTQHIERHDVAGAFPDRIDGSSR